MIILIDNYDSFTFNLYQALLTLGEEVMVYRNDAIDIAGIQALQPNGIVISPGPGRPSQAGISLAVVNTFLKTTPILGVCLGHQSIVEALGGAVTLADAPVHGKPTFVFHHQHGLYAGMPEPFKAARYHSLIATRDGLPDELIIEAENDTGLIMGVKHRDYPCYGVQFHPESVLTPEGNQLLGNFVRCCQQQQDTKAIVGDATC